MIVVDTTVWIDFLEGRGTIFDRHLAELLESDAPIALHNDRDFDALARVSDLTIHHPA